MKKVIFSALALGVLVFSCQKENIEPVEQNNESAVVENIDVDEDFEEGSGIKASSLRVFWKLQGSGGQVICGCSGANGNCLETVVVDGNARPAGGGIIISNVINVINHEINSAIVSVFTEEQTNLEMIIDAHLVRGVIDGSLTVQNDGEFTSESEAYLQFSKFGSEKIFVVVPITLK